VFSFMVLVRIWRWFVVYCWLVLFIRDYGLGNSLRFALDCDCARCSGTLYAWAWAVFLEFWCLGALASGWFCLCVPFLCRVRCVWVFFGFGQGLFHFVALVPCCLRLMVASVPGDCRYCICCWIKLCFGSWFVCQVFWTFGYVSWFL
jgi:hypothetical protein